jgi:hypothetical protein
VAERKTKVQVVPGGPLVEGVAVGVDESSEKWSEYRLEDGTTIRLKQVLVDVTRTALFDPEGNPQYVVKAQPVLAIVEVPDRLKQKKH